MAKELKLWNGRAHGKYTHDRSKRYHMNVAAYSFKQAATLLSLACKSFVTTHEIKDYYSPVWGDDMVGITPKYPCVYVVDRNEPVPAPLMVERIAPHPEKQMKVLEYMKDGYTLSVAMLRETWNPMLQKNGDRTHHVSMSTVTALLNKKLIGHLHDLNFRHYYKLTELGKSI